MATVARGSRLHPTAQNACHPSSLWTGLVRKPADPVQHGAKGLHLGFKERAFLLRTAAL